MNLKIPFKFYQDHKERDLPTPKALQYIGKHVVIDSNDPALKDLIEDAEHYADPEFLDGAGDAQDRKALRPLCKSAAATLKAIWKN